MSEKIKKQERLRDQSYHPNQHDKTVQKRGRMTIHHPHASMAFKLIMIFVMTAFIVELYYMLQA